MTDAAVHLSDLTVEYPAHGGHSAHRVLDGLNLRVAHGEVLGIIGEAGAGKSTIARVLSGQSGLPGGQSPRIVGGDATVLGYSLRTLHGRRRTQLTRQLGLLPQNAGAALTPDLSVGELCAAPVYAMDRRASPADTGLRVAALIDAVNLPLKVLDQYPHELTSGQRQRVAIARALVLEPRLVIADDPTAGIDISVRQTVIDVLGGPGREFAAVIVSNDLAVLRRVSQRVAVVHQGMLVGLGPLDEVLRHPLHPYVSQIAAADQAGQG